jgi:hypothetical protein
MWGALQRVPASAILRTRGATAQALRDVVGRVVGHDPGRGTHATVGEQDDVAIFGELVDERWVLLNRCRWLSSG